MHVCRNTAELVYCLSDSLRCVMAVYPHGNSNLVHLFKVASTGFLYIKIAFYLVSFFLWFLFLIEMEVYACA